MYMIVRKMHNEYELVEHEYADHAPINCVANSSKQAAVVSLQLPDGRNTVPFMLLLSRGMNEPECWR